jgi:succinate-semialdehyde dehydrogenase/glutarate-semialdehyde dehydrogenase
MTALKHVDVPVTTESVRPGWVTDEVLDRLTGRVFRDSGNASEPLHPVAPYDGQVTTAIPTSTADDVTRAVAEARLGAAAWRTRSYADRAAVMLRFHDLFLARQDEVIDLIQWEMGKARFSAWQEILQVANIARHYSRVGAKYLSPTSVRGAVPGLTQVKETRVPKGVVGVISPWNYPFYLGVGDVIPALLAGNAVVSKADSQTALTLLHARDLMAEAGLPTDAWHVVAGRGGVIGTALIDAVDYICFTGSTSTGRTVGEQADRRIIGASLELGG